LDNAGKTTIVKKIRGEDTSTVSPTLGFQIRTVQHGRYLPLALQDFKVVEGMFASYYEG
jgi:hypothetical protein